jgi:hypothetical protein
MARKTTVYLKDSYRLVLQDLVQRKLYLSYQDAIIRGLDLLFDKHEISDEQRYPKITEEVPVDVNPRTIVRNLGGVEEPDVNFTGRELVMGYAALKRTYEIERQGFRLLWRGKPASPSMVRLHVYFTDLERGTTTEQRLRKLGLTEEDYKSYQAWRKG